MRQPRAGRKPGGTLTFHSRCINTATVGRFLIGIRLRPKVQLLHRGGGSSPLGPVADPTGNWLSAFQSSRAESGVIHVAVDLGEHTSKFIAENLQDRPLGVKGPDPPGKPLTLFHRHTPDHFTDPGNLGGDERQAS